MNQLLQRIHQNWDRRSMNTKFLLIFVMVLVLPVTLLDVAFFSMTMRSVRENSRIIMEANMQNTLQSINAKVEMVEKNAEILALDDNTRNAFGNHYKDETQRVIDYQLNCARSAHNLLYLNPDINAIYHYNENVLIGQMTDSFFSVQKSASPDIFNRFQLRPISGLSQWVLSRKGLSNVVRPDRSPADALAYQRIVTAHAGHKCAYIEIVIDEKVIFNSLYEQTLLGDGYMMVVDDGGNIIASTSGNSGQMIQHWGFEDYTPGACVNRIENDAVQIALPISGLDASLVTSVSLRSLYSELYSTMPNILLLSLGSVLLCCWLFSALAKKQLRGIPPMMRAMHQIRKGDFSTRLTSTGQDELGALASDFNYMSEKLEELMDEVYVAGQMEREAELRALEANINPHFLYNSLATITWMARLKNCPEITETTQALATLYRMVLSQGKSIISFDDEMQIVTAYLKVQKTRYEDRFDVSIDVSDEARAFPVIKNILQPLVENALEHGIAPKREKGHIRIYARVVNNRLDICVVDDGVGMSEERRREVAGGNVDAQRRGGYAIKNILERLKVFYGNRYEFALHAQVDKGVTVQLVLPYASQLMERR